MSALPRSSPALLSLWLLAAGCADGGAVDGAQGGAGGAGGPGAGPDASSTDGAGGHGCFATETVCNGACIDVMSHPLHCGMCNHPCSTDPMATGTCVDGQCAGGGCAAGFADDMGVCKNFFGAHEAYPSQCAGCQVQNAYTSACSCPAQTTELSLHAQSDCPGMPLRAATELKLCVTTGVTAESDFGGAYEVDDLDGWCGATAQCRVGNPMAGGACACPAGFDDTISLRSIIRLPCDNGEVGNVLVLCGNREAPTTSFGGAYQFDDLGTQCRVTNPWTGDCSCPPGMVDRGYRAMVDGPDGLYGSVIHLCTPT
jgi:hypothetical protein